MCYKCRNNLFSGFDLSSQLCSLILNHTESAGLPIMLDLEIPLIVRPFLCTLWDILDLFFFPRGFFLHWLSSLFISTWCWALLRQGLSMRVSTSSQDPISGWATWAVEGQRQIHWARMECSSKLVRRVRYRYHLIVQTVRERGSRGESPHMCRFY